MHTNECLINALLRKKEEINQILTGVSVLRARPLELLKRHLGSPLIKVVIGPRRAGKSTLVLQALKGGAVAYVNLEDEAVLGDLADNDTLITALDKVYPNSDYVLLDEVQNIPQWEMFLNRQHRRGRNLIVTGSNSKMLSKELSTSLTGRHISVVMLRSNIGVETTPSRGDVAEQHRGGNTNYSPQKMHPRSGDVKKG
jgi:predicted AAA+ superfamily ATPase